MATSVDSSCASSNSSDDDDDAGTPSDFCQHCKSELDPLLLTVNVKTFNILVECGCCGEINKAGKWAGAISSPVIKLHHIHEVANIICHTRIHTEEKPYECEDCGKKFRHRSSFYRHKMLLHRIHTGEKPHECKDCGKKFRQSANFYRHKMIHTGEKPHVCEDCGKKFRHSSTFYHHKMLHTEEKQHECEDCGKKFIRKDRLNYHMRYLHTCENLVPKRDSQISPS